MKTLEKVKKPIQILTIIVIGMLFTVTGYAVSKYFASSESQTSVYNKKTYFEFVMPEVFTQSGEIGPGDSMNMNPVITSNATMDMFVFLRVEEPAYNGGGLYSITPGNGWTIVESFQDGSKWIEVYQYDDVLGPGSSTVALSSSLKMTDMSRSEYAEISDVNITITGFAIGTDEEELENAWTDIKDHFGL